MFFTTSYNCKYTEEELMQQTMYFSILILALRPPKEDENTSQIKTVSAKTSISGNMRKLTWLWLVLLLLRMQLGVVQSGDSAVVVQEYTLFNWKMYNAHEI